MLLKQTSVLLKHSWHKKCVVLTISSFILYSEVNVIILIPGKSQKKVFLYETSINSVESAMCVLIKSKTALFLNFLLCTILEKTRNRSRGATSELLFAFSIIILD